VLNVNEAPVFSSPASFSVQENTTAVGTVAASDPDGLTVTYSLYGGVDAAFFSINSTSGALSFISAPDFEVRADSGANNVYNVIVLASDGVTGLQQALSITVTNVNETPVIISNGGGAAAAISRSENGTSVTTVQASDPEGGSATYAIAGGADAARFAINPTTGALAFVAAPDFEAPGDAGGDNVYDVIVSASDGTSSDTQAIAVTVTNSNDPAVISSNGGGATATITIDENTTFVTTVVASDIEGDQIAYLITGGIDLLSFSLHSGSGFLQFLAAPDFEAPTDAGANNSYTVEVSANDGNENTRQTLTIVVANVNEAPVITSGGGGASAAISVIENTSRGDHGRRQRSRRRRDLRDLRRRRRRPLHDQRFDRRTELRCRAELRGAGRCRRRQCL
jgi:hypothetical protein